MQRRLAIGIGIALAAIPWLAAADPAPTTGAGVIDCLWSGTPPSFQQSFSGSVDSSHFDALLDAYTPTDEQLVALADHCRLTGSADQPAPQIAALAIMSRAEKERIPLHGSAISMAKGDPAPGEERIEVPFRMLAMPITLRA